MDQDAVFTPVLRSERLTMTLYDAEADTPFLVELLDSFAEFVPEPLGERVFTDEIVRRLLKNTTLSPHNCLGLNPTRPSVSKTDFRIGIECEV